MGLYIYNKQENSQTATTLPYLALPVFIASRQKKKKMKNMLRSVFQLMMLSLFFSPFYIQGAPGLINETNFNLMLLDDERIGEKLIAFVKNLGHHDPKRIVLKTSRKNVTGDLEVDSDSDVSYDLDSEDDGDYSASDSERSSSDDDQLESDSDVSDDSYDERIGKRLTAFVKNLGHHYPSGIVLKTSRENVEDDLELDSDSDVDDSDSEDDGDYSASDWEYNGSDDDQ